MVLLRSATLLVAALSLYACLSRERSADSAAGDADAVATPAGQPRDAATPDAQFLVDLSNHHEGLVHLAMTAMNNTSREATRRDAHRIHLSRMAQRDSMIMMLRSRFGIEHVPRISPAHIVRADSVPRLSGEARDALFYRLLITHHEEGLRIIRQQLPRLRDARVRALAEGMQSDKQTAIAGFDDRR